MRRVATILAAVTVAAAATVQAAPSGAAAAPGSVVAEPVLTGLDFPAAFVVAPDGRIFYGDRFTGEIRIFDPQTSSDTLFFTVPRLETNGERGLLGLALHPGYPDHPFVYAYATQTVGGVARNRVLKITDAGGTGSSARAIFTSNVRSQTIHNGGHIAFGPDRRLYVVIGDASDPSNSQDLTEDAGKMLRMTGTGGVPADNPFGTRVFAYGIRNSFGFTFDPQTGRLWETENGPECNDEINLIGSGDDMGWGPEETCSTPPQPPLNTNQSGPNPVLPKAYYGTTIAPTGAAFCDSCGIGVLEGQLVFGAWNTGRIQAAALTGDRTDVASIHGVLDHGSGILSIQRGPDGLLYFSDAGAIYRLTSG